MTSLKEFLQFSGTPWKTDEEIEGYIKELEAEFNKFDTIHFGGQLPINRDELHRVCLTAYCDGYRYAQSKVLRFLREGEQNAL